MPRFDVYRILGAEDRHVLDVQSEFLSYLKSRIVIPLLPQDGIMTPASDLNPAIEISDGTFIVITQELTAVPLRSLTRPVGLLAPEYWDKVTRAIDVLLTGF